MVSRAVPILQVAAKAAIINDEGKVLIVREAATGANNTKVGEWGLVGGRLEAGESFIDGLRREVKEETGLEVKVLAPLEVGEWHPVILGREHQIIAIFMLCSAVKGDVVMSAEHDGHAWIDPVARARYPMMKPDCDVIDKLRRSPVVGQIVSTGG